MQVNVHEAKTQLSKLIEAALRGEEVIIARDSKPAVRLVAIEKPRFKIGMPGFVGMPVPDFLEPMTDADLAEWE